MNDKVKEKLGGAQAPETLSSAEDMFKVIGCDDLEKDTIARPTITYWQDAVRRLRKNKLSMAALVVVVLLVLLVIFGPMLQGHDYVTIDAANKNLSPSGEHWFGTDSLGRDLFARIWLGARVSMIVALACTVVQVVVGCAYGGAMAYFGGKVDYILMRILETLNAIPSLLVTILVMMILGNNMFSLLIALCVTSWIGTARQMRGLILQLKNSEYVMAARALGSSPWRIIVKHLIPNTIGVLILLTASSIPTYIFSEAGLAFLGMGLQPPAISLGVLISLGQTTMDFYPFQLFFPAAVLCLTVLSFNILGDGLRDALDPRMRH